MKKFTFYLRQAAYLTLLILLVVALFAAFSAGAWIIMVGLCCVGNVAPTFGLLMIACIFGLMATVCLVLHWLDII